MPTVTIGFVPRERFSAAAESLQSIFDCTHIPFNLVIVDCAIPQQYRQQMEKVLQGRSNVKVIRTDRYLLPNQAKNLVIQESKDDFVCLTENDVLVGEDWLSCLIAACEEQRADVAVPLISEGGEHSGRVHFDQSLGQILPVQQADGVKLEIVPRSTPKKLDKSASRRFTELIEGHCVLFRRNVFSQIGTLDETLSVRACVDLSLALYSAKVPVVFEPKCRVTFLPPPPVQPDERDFFYFRWDIEQALNSNDRIQEKWNVVNLKSAIKWMKVRHQFGWPSIMTEEITALIPTTDAFILVDEERWRGSEVIGSRQAIPFPEHDGQYGGRPSDDETAIRELERLRQAGASFIVFVWDAFWWLDFYTGLHQHLRSHFRCILRNERLIVFEL